MTTKERLVQQYADTPKFDVLIYTSRKGEIFASKRRLRDQENPKIPSGATVERVSQ